MQDAVSAEFCAVVERQTGRRVRTFMSQFDPEHDVQAELFFLEPG